MRALPVPEVLAAAAAGLESLGQNLIRLESDVADWLPTSAGSLTSRVIAARYEELKARGREPLAIKERCRRAGRLAEYETLYVLYCMDSHNSGAALAERHLSDQPSGIPLVSFFAQPAPQMVARRLEFGMGTVMQAGRMTHGAFRVKSDQLETRVQRYHRERADRLKLFSPESAID